MKWLTRVIIPWLPPAIAVTGLCLLVCAAVQQNYRQSLNDPQIQLAEDGAARLALGGVPAELVQRGVPSVDAGKSLAPWIAVYDESGTVLESSAVVDGRPPTPPKGIFDAAKAGEGKDSSLQFENRVTWQTASGVRNALVVVWVPETKQFVVSGRNMREVEEREGRLTTIVTLAWLVLLAATLVTKTLARRFV